MDEALFTENHGSLGYGLKYYRDASNKICAQRTNNAIKSFFQIILGFFYEVLLPQGFPKSVSKDYVAYQLWDTIQAFCSTITAAFTTQAILKGVGVGNAAATALSATITWILKDGTGLIGRILFTWYKGKGLDCNCKKWRLFADVINDIAMILELIIPIYSTYSMQMLCVSATLKSIVGVAGGATRAAITEHQAIKGNMAEISAKDGSQESLVNLIASLISIYLLNVVTDVYQWYFITFLMIIHLYANYKAVTVLVFTNLNEARMCILLQGYLVLNTVYIPEKINEKESVFLGFGPKVKKLCGFDIKMGHSLKEVIGNYDFEVINTLMQLYKDKNYIIVPDPERRVMYVIFKEGETNADVIAAYFESVLFGVFTCYYNNTTLSVDVKRHLHYSTPISRLYKILVNANSEAPEEIPLLQLESFQKYVEKEIPMFFTALSINGWSVNTIAFEVGEWRVKDKSL